MSKRDDILEAALRLFAEKGFHGTAMPELAKAAGVGAGTIYRHFDSKEALVNELYRLWKRRLLAANFDSLPTEGTWRSRVLALWRSNFAFALAHPHAVRFLDLHHHSDYLDAESKLLEQQSAAGFIALVVDGQREEVFVDAPPAALIGQVYGGFLGLLRAADEGRITLDEALIEATGERAWALLRR